MNKLIERMKRHQEAENEWVAIRVGQYLNAIDSDPCVWEDEDEAIANCMDIFVHETTAYMISGFQATKAAEFHGVPADHYLGQRITQVIEDARQQYRKLVGVDHA